MSCCKGYTAKCKKCGFIGCQSCQVTCHTLDGSYCSECYDKLETQSELSEAYERIKYLKSLLKKNNIKYDHSEDSYSWEEYPDLKDDDCKTQ